MSAPLAPVTVAVNACASPTTDGPACVSFTVSARAGAAASMVPASTTQEATARIWFVQFVVNVDFHSVASVLPTKSATPPFGSTTS